MTTIAAYLRHTQPAIYHVLTWRARQRFYRKLNRALRGW